MSPQYSEHGRRKSKPLPPSSIEHPWTLVRNSRQFSNQVAYLTKAQEYGYVGMLLDLDCVYGWQLAEQRLLFIPKTDVLHVFPREPEHLGIINAAWSELQAERKPGVRWS